MRRKVFCLSYILLIFLFGIFFDFFKKDKKIDKELPIINVVVKGAVRAQGTYYVRYGVSMGELLEKCGGITDIGYLPYDFDYNAPITEDITITVHKRYTLKKKLYEEN